MESVARLRSVIVEALGSQGQQTIQQELFDELMIHRPRLLKVFDVGSRDAQQQREIESGMLHIYLFMLQILSMNPQAKQ